MKNEWYKLPKQKLFKIVNGKPFMARDAFLGKVAIILNEKPNGLCDVQVCNAMFLFKEGHNICRNIIRSALTECSRSYLLAQQELHKDDAVNFLNSPLSKRLINLIKR